MIAAEELTGTETVGATRVRVLYLMPDFGVGGAERALLLIARHARSAGIDMHVASVGSPRRPRDETVLPSLEDLGVPIWDLAVEGKPSRSLRALVRACSRLRRLCRDEGIEVVDSCLFDADLVSRLALVGTSARQVVHLVNTPYDPAVRAHSRSRGRWRLEAVRWLDARTAFLTDGFVALTEAVAQQDAHDLRLERARMDVIPRGVDLTEFSPQPMPGAGALKLLSVGRLVPQKGHETALRALAIVRDQGHDAMLSIAGEGPLESSLRDLVEELDLHDRVTFLQPTKNVVALHRDHHAFMFPSLWEGQGNALLEAMGCARPTVAADIPPLREVLGGEAIFAAPGDADDLARGVIRLATMSGSERTELGARARRRVEARFSDVDQVHRLAGYYRSLGAR